VRDPRDAIYSSYRYFHNFSRFWWPDGDKAQGTFGEYLDGLGVNDEPPIQGWVDFYRAWYATLPTLPRHAIVRFEDLKTDPSRSWRICCGRSTCRGPMPSINRAVDRSSFEYSAQRTRSRSWRGRRSTVPRWRTGHWSCNAAR